MTFAGAVPGFWMRTQVVKPQAVAPSGKYHVFEGEFTPIELCPSPAGWPGPFQVIVRSTAMGSPSLHSTRVEKSALPR